MTRPAWFWPAIAGAWTAAILLLGIVIGRMSVPDPRDFSPGYVQAESPVERKARVKAIMDQTDEEMREAFRRAEVVTREEFKRMGIESP